jgi:phosphoribosylformylglycinamidine (FGAM) synthase-like amidotransferase family enzyme
LKGARDEEDENGIPSVPDVFLDHNLSDRYESRFPTVKIEKSNSIMLKDMEGTFLGVWIAHAEGCETLHVTYLTVKFRLSLLTDFYTS